MCPARTCRVYPDSMTLAWQYCGAGGCWWRRRDIAERPTSIDGGRTRDGSLRLLFQASLVPPHEDRQPDQEADREEKRCKPDRPSQGVNSRSETIGRAGVERGPEDPARDVEGEKPRPSHFVGS